MMERRTFVVGSITVLAAPPIAQAQVSGRVPRVGYLGFFRSQATLAFEQGLKDLGWEDGRNIVLEGRWAQGTWRDSRHLPPSWLGSTST